MGEVVGCCVGLDGKLQLSDYLIVDNDLQGDITDGSRIGESTFDLFDSKPGVFTHEILYRFDCLNYISEL